MSYILALDQGAASSCAIAVAAGGVIVGMAREKIPQYYPEPAWVEHDPTYIRTTQIGIARQVLHDCGLTCRDITGTDITRQRETTLI